MANYVAKETNYVANSVALPGRLSGRQVEVMEQAHEGVLPGLRVTIGHCIGKVRVLLNRELQA